MSTPSSPSARATPFSMSSPPRSSTIASSPPLELEGTDIDPKSDAEANAPMKYINEVDTQERLTRLNFLLKKSSVYSQIIGDQMARARAKHAESAENVSLAPPAKGRGKGKAKAKARATPATAKTRGKGRGSAKRVRADSDEEEEEEQTVKRVKTTDAVREEGKRPFTQPALLTGATLKDYQLEGVAWMVGLWESGVSGILADEMGLGKTIQTIAFIAHLRVRVEAPCLVVCPLGVLHNWMDEFARFAPDVPTCMYHGSREEREKLRETVMPIPPEEEEPSTSAPKVDNDEDLATSTKQKSTFPVVITTYEMIMRDRAHLSKYKWGFVVVDEGHRLKNMDSVLMREIKKYPSAGRMILTGTPLQNNLSELWSLLNFILPDIFDDVDSFQEWFNLPTLSNAIEDEQSSQILHTLHEILKPFLLRRVKADVERDLPPKKEYVLYAPLSQRQHEIYDAIVKGGVRGLLTGSKPEEEAQTSVSDEEDDGGKGRHKLRRRTANLKYDVDGSDREYFKRLEKGEIKGLRDREEEANRRKSAVELGMEYAYQAKLKKINNLRLQNVVMQLRKVCSHPFLFDWPVDPRTSQPVVNDELVNASGKMMVLERLLDELFRRGHKVLVFSQFKIMLDVIEDWATEFKHWPLCRIDGSTPVADRHAEMERFQTGGDAPDAPRLFLLSTRAAGIGINLTAADTVVFYDQDWNPQMDLQAQDRAHRIGQTKPVLIFRLVSKHTIEGKIMQRAGEKRQLEALVIAKGEFKMPTKAGSKRETMTELASSLLALESEKIEVVPGTTEGKNSVISDKDLDRLLDRRPEVIERRVAGWNAKADTERGAREPEASEDVGAFEVYEAPVDEGNDALARMMGEDD